MAITSLEDYIERLSHPMQQVHFGSLGLSFSGGRVTDLRRGTLPLGEGTTVTVAGIPTTATAYNRTNSGAFYMRNGGAGALTCIGGCFNTAAYGAYYLTDILTTQGGLSGTVTTAQTTNLPTAALTRYTSGEGLRIGLTIYTQIGSTATTVTASYTNQAGTAGRTTVATGFGGTAYREANRLIELPLQVGDTGVRSVESVTVLATTDTAGAFGVSIFKPLCMFLIDDVGQSMNNNLFTAKFFGGLPEIVDDAYLNWLYVGVSSTVNNGVLYLTEH